MRRKGERFRSEAGSNVGSAPFQRTGQSGEEGERFKCEPGSSVPASDGFRCREKVQILRKTIGWEMWCA